MGACKEEELQVPNDSFGCYTIEVQADIPQTKTVLNDQGNRSYFRFNKGDKIGLYAENKDLKNVCLECTSETGLFKKDLTLSEPIAYYLSLDYYSYSPYKEDAGQEATAMCGLLPDIQVAPFDGDADYLIADPLNTYDDVKDFPELAFRFSTHLFAIVKLRIQNTDDALSEEQLLDVGLKSGGGPLAGSFLFNIKDPSQYAIFSDNPEKLYNRVHVWFREEERPVLGKGVTHTVYAIVKPSFFESGSLELVATTTNYRFSLPSTSDVSLERGKVSVFPVVDLSEARVEKASDTKKLLSFSLSDGSRIFEPFDITNGVISIMVPNKADVSNLTASFAHDGSYVSVDGIEQISGETHQDFSDFANPLHYSVHSSSGETQTYVVKIFDLPVVSIETPGRQEIKDKVNWIPEEPFTPGTGSVITIREIADDGTITSKTYEDAQVRGRGNTTWVAPKKPYTFKLGSKASVLGMPADKRWTLLANWFDKTAIRNDVSFELAHRADGMGWASHGKFVELFLNGEHLGNYYLCEHNKVAKNRVDITEMSVDDNSGDAITGGYLLEYDQWKDNDPHFTSNIIMTPKKEGTRIKFKSPDDAGFETQWAWIENYVHELETLLVDDEAVTAHRYLNYMDIDSYIDYWFVYEIAGTQEPNNPGSCFMYKDRGGKMHAGPVWDFDNYTFLPSSKGFRIKNALYYKYLFKDPLFVARVKERWPLYVSKLYNMPDYIESQIESISRSMMRDSSLWPEAGGPYNGDASLSTAEASARLKSSYEARISILTSLINALVATPSNSGTGNEDYEPQGNKTGDFGFGF